MKKPPLLNDHIYHIYNRGVEKRKIFLNKEDYFRFTHNLFEFNDESPAINLNFHLGGNRTTKLSNLTSEVGLPKLERKPRKLLVDILAFCLMPNHFHLLLQQRKNHGITNFMRKMGTGYTNYFNKKYNRVGPLFQGKFKAILLEDDTHFRYLPFYIHANPLALMPPQERRNPKTALRFLESYRWSSYPDYIGKKNIPSVTSRAFLWKSLGGPADHHKEMLRWVTAPQLQKVSDAAFDADQ